MTTRPTLAILLALLYSACGGGGGGGNGERVIAVLPVSYDFVTASSTDAYPFCFANMGCVDIVQQDQFGVAITLAQVDLNTTPGVQPIVREAQDSFVSVLADALTDNQVGPLAATFMVAGQAPGCIDATEANLVLQEPGTGVDLVGFTVTGVALAIDTLNRTPTQVQMTGRVLVYGQTAP